MDMQSSAQQTNRSQDALPTVVTKSLQSRLEAQRDQLDPRKDGWLTESLTEEVYGQLAALKTPGNIRQDLLKNLVTPGFSCGDLRPKKLDTVLEDRSLTVLRPPGVTDSDTFKGVAGFTQALQALYQPFMDARDAQVKFKVIRVNITGSTLETEAHYEAHGHTSSGMLQQNATWHCRWSPAPGGWSAGPPLLEQIEARGHEEVLRADENGKPLFSDCTIAVLGKNQSFVQQLRVGIDSWCGRVETAHGMDLFTRNGLAMGDVNGDGLEDIYVCQPGGLPNRLYVQQIDGACIDRSREAGVDWLNQTSSALIVDLDNDADQDLVVAVESKLLVMENNGSGQFQLRAELPTGSQNVQSLTAADYDSDSRLDLYICHAFADADSESAQIGFLYHDSNDGGPNRLFRNQITEKGDWNFVDVTGKVGLDDDANHRYSLASAWEDYDNDGDLDLYVANDYGRNCLYRNDSSQGGTGQFTNVTEMADVVDFGSGMSVSWGDFNHDGLMDLYVGNMFSSAGSRITRQQQFKPTADTSIRTRYQRFAKGNTLFENLGSGKFRELTDAGVEMGRWAWSSVFVDINNDSWEDLVVANGYMTTEDTGDL